MHRRVYAALVKTLGQAPCYELTDLPPPAENQVQVKVIAAGIHQLVRSITSGKHYLKSATLPLTAGVDGVGTLSDGQKVFFMTAKPPNGSMSEYVNVDREMTIPLPEGADPITFAASVNPGLGSWIALRERAQIQPDESVLILGVTGNAGQMAAVSARLLGAKHIIGVGRNKTVLDQLVANGTINVPIPLTDDNAQLKSAIEKEAADVDVALDYLWGQPAETTLSAIESARKNPTQCLRWVQIGQMAGDKMQCPATLLRSKNVIINGSGFGAISTSKMLENIKHMIPMVMDGKLSASVTTISLKDIEKKWDEMANSKERVVVLI